MLKNKLLLVPSINLHQCIKLKIMNIKLDLKFGCTQTERSKFKKWNKFKILSLEADLEDAWLMVRLNSYVWVEKPKNNVKDQAYAIGKQILLPGTWDQEMKKKSRNPIYQIPSLQLEL